MDFMLMAFEIGSGGKAPAARAAMRAFARAGVVRPVIGVAEGGHRAGAVFGVHLLEAPGLNREHHRQQRDGRAHQCGRAAFGAVDEAADVNDDENADDGHAATSGLEGAGKKSAGLTRPPVATWMRSRIFGRGMRSPDLYRHNAWRLTPIWVANAASLVWFLASHVSRVMPTRCHQSGDGATDFVTKLETRPVAYLVTASGHE